ncbi:MAG: hypothetical protein NZ700_02590 [Gemmataceae bacterium]|nr:hypothetical protein [Gemmataceae bacterium]MDW8264189.1 hypothetical protein [Gemmataceae bacterium]
MRLPRNARFVVIGWLLAWAGSAAAQQSGSGGGVVLSQPVGQPSFAGIGAGPAFYRPYGRPWFYPAPSPLDEPAGRGGCGKCAASPTVPQASSPRQTARRSSIRAPSGVAARPMCSGQPCGMSAASMPAPIPTPGSLAVAVVPAHYLSEAPEAILLRQAIEAVCAGAAENVEVELTAADAVRVVLTVDHPVVGQELAKVIYNMPELQAYRVYLDVRTWPESP